MPSRSFMPHRRTINRRRSAPCLVLAVLSIAAAAPADDAPRWQETSRIRPGKSHTVPALWGDLPKLTKRTTRTILEADGPGVVSAVHACAFIGVGTGAGWNGDSPGAQSVIIRVYYDKQQTPAIEMPLMDFLGDIQCGSVPFSTVYMSKVRFSHNFRLPMPFREHIRVELENPSDEDFAAYTDVQWERVDRIPDDVGCLRVDYRSGTFTADKPVTLCEINRPATIVAHWLQYESPHSVRGEQLCEADHHIFLDGDAEPTLNYQGTEDLYGFSWGFQHGTQHDQRCAITKVQQLEPAGSRVATLRCRTDDAIRFQESCRWVITYANDPTAMNNLGQTPIPYRHCVYYYAAN